MPAGTRWRKSSASLANGNCVEVGTFRKSSHSAYHGSCAEVATWRRSSRCASGECAEVASCCHGVAVRDSKDRSGPVLVVAGSTWGRFLTALRRGGIPS